MFVVQGSPQVTTNPGYQNRRYCETCGTRDEDALKMVKNLMVRSSPDAKNGVDSDDDIKDDDDNDDGNEDRATKEARIDEVVALDEAPFGFRWFCKYSTAAVLL
jgi:hypothetical protein